MQIQPTDGAFNLLSEVTFSWHTVEYFGVICEGRDTDSNRVELLLDKNPFPTTVVAVVQETNSSVTTVTIPNLTTGQYYWMVRAVSSDNVTAGSSIRTFSVCVDSPPRTPLLLSPFDGEIDVHPSLDLTWLPMNFLAGDYGK